MRPVGVDHHQPVAVAVERDAEVGAIRATTSAAAVPGAVAPHRR
jgi:hypothetical protein